jgi:proton-translocating NADH-quinone oxidoreductase chain N
MQSVLVLAPLILLAVFNLPFLTLKERSYFFLTAFLCVTQAFLVLLHPVLFWSSYPDPLGPFVAFNLTLDTLALVMLLSIAIVSFSSLCVARVMMIMEKQRRHFLNLLLLAITGMNTMVMVSDVFSLYVFMEITAVSLFVLIALDKSAAAIEGTFKYLSLSVVAGVLMLTGIALFLLTSGSTSFSSLYGAFAVEGNRQILTFASGLFLCGLLIKSGAVPFHGWLPDAYQAASPAVSILLAGIVTKITGVYALLRLFGTVFVLTPGVQNVLLTCGMFSIVVAAVAALTQRDMKRMLAYSSISQVGYIILALGCATPLAFAGAVFHFFNHAVFKSLLFVNAASIERRFGSTDMGAIKGRGEGMTSTALTGMAGFLSAAGVPPLAGFWSKLIIITALCQAGRYGYAAAALLAGLLTLGYFLALQKKVFLVKVPGAARTLYRAPAGLTILEISLAAVTVGMGLGYPLVLNTWILPLQHLFR